MCHFKDSSNKSSSPFPGRSDLSTTFQTLQSVGGHPWRAMNECSEGGGKKKKRKRRSGRNDQWKRSLWCG